MRTQETCTILIETDFLSVRTFFFPSTLLYLQTLPIPSPSKICVGGVPNLDPSCTSLPGSANAPSAPPLPPTPAQGQNQSRHWQAARTGAGLGRGETERKGAWRGTPGSCPHLQQLFTSLPWVPGPYLPQEVPAIGPGFTLALELVAKRAGTEAVLLLILTDAAAQGGRCAHVLGVLNPVAPKLGQDDQGVWASLLHNLEAEGESGTAACPGSTEEGRGAGGVPQPSNRSKEGIPSLRPKAVT